jgi:hypothetical protein
MMKAAYRQAIWSRLACGEGNAAEEQAKVPTYGCRISKTYFLSAFADI